MRGGPGGQAACMMVEMSFLGNCRETDAGSETGYYKKKEVVHGR